MSLKNLWLLSALAVLSWRTANGQQAIQPHLSGGQRRLLRQIIRCNKMESKFVGEAGMLSAQYVRFDSLRRLSSQTDLLAFTHHTSPVVRAYAFSSLVEQRDGQNAFNVLQTNVQDTSIFHHRFGCIGGTSTVRLFMLVNLRSAAKSDRISLTAAQQQQLEDLYEKLQIDNDEKKIVNRQIKLK